MARDYINFSVSLMERLISGYRQSEVTFSFDIRDRAIDVAMGYAPGGRWVEFESRQGQDFSPVHIVQTGPGPHPASSPMGNKVYFPEVKRPGLKLITHLQLLPRSRMVELYFHSPIHLHSFSV
jgi:hypothetical protein